MTPGTATVVYALAILVLFRLDRDRKSPVSAALWLPVAWMSIGASRAVSQWLQLAPVMESPDQYVDGSPLDRLILAGLLAGGVIVLLTRGQRVGTVLRANGPLLVFFYYCAASVLWSDYPFVAFKRWTKALGNLVMVLIVLTETDPSAAVKRFLVRSGFLLVPLSVLLIKYYPDLGRGYTPWTWMPYYIGVAGDKNGLGVVCMVFGLGSLWRLVEGLHSRERPGVAGPLIAHGAVLAMAIWLFWKASSATALGCFLAGGGLILFTGRSRLAPRPAAAHVLVVAIVSLCLLGVFVAPELGLVQAMGRNSTLTGRTELWEELIQMSEHPWVGTGFESFWLGDRAKALWENHWWHPNEAHNGYLEVFLNLGWVGVALLGFVMAWGYRNVVRSLRLSPELSRLRLAYFIVAVLYNMTEAGFKVMHPVWITFVLAIIATPPETRRENSWDGEVPLLQENRRTGLIL